MVAKGAWLNRAVILRQAKQTNKHDVDIEKTKALGTALEAAVCRGYTYMSADLRREIAALGEKK